MCCFGIYGRHQRNERERKSTTNCRVFREQETRHKTCINITNFLIFLISFSHPVYVFTYYHLHLELTHKVMFFFFLLVAPYKLNICNMKQQKLKQ